MKFVSTFNAVHLTDDPSIASGGELYFNSASNVFRYYNSGSWINVVSSVDLKSSSIREIYRPNEPATASFSLTLSENLINTIIICESSEFFNIIVPNNDESPIPIGSSFEIIRGAGDGIVNFIEGGGVFIDAPSSIYLTTIWSTAIIIKLSETSWVINSNFADIY